MSKFIFFNLFFSIWGLRFKIYFTVKFDSLFENNLFLELAYVTLSTWGLDRLDGKVRLVKFIEFKESTLKNLDLLI